MAAIWAYFGGYLLWGLLTVDFFNDHLGSATGVMKDPPDMIHLAIGCIIVGFAFSAIYGKWGHLNFGTGSGLTFGVWIGIMIGLGQGLVNYATSNIIDITGTFVDAVIYIVFYGIMGLLVGLIYSKTHATPMP